MTMGRETVPKEGYAVVSNETQKGRGRKEACIASHPDTRAHANSPPSLQQQGRVLSFPERFVAPSGEETV